MIRQGVTTAVVGQDGGSTYPLAKFFSDLEAKRVALNIASFVGHGSARGFVLGSDDKRAATPAEVLRMRTYIAEGMRAGALGLSSGLEYDPGLYGTTEEIIACAKVASAYGGMYISHVRDEENDALTSFGELVRIAGEARLPGQISHIKLGSSPVWNKAGAVLQMMADAGRRGVSVTADVYPYTYWQSTITVIIPTRDWDDRKQWETGLAEIGGPRNVLLTTYSPDAAWVGKTIAEIARTTGKDAVSIIQEIVRKTHGPGASGRESVVVTAMQGKRLEDVFGRAERHVLHGRGTAPQPPARGGQLSAHFRTLCARTKGFAAGRSHPQSDVAARRPDGFSGPGPRPARLQGRPGFV
jgi:N-acyl-D-amino-acid deacylase